MRLNSRHLTSIEYGSDVPNNDGHRVTLHRGVNDVSDRDLELLKASPSFNKHAKAGMFVELPPEQVGELAAPPAPAEDPRAKRKGESDKTYKARMKALDDEATDAAAKASADAEFLAAYDAMSEDERAAFYATLTDDMKKLIDERVKS